MRKLTFLRFFLLSATMLLFLSNSMSQPQYAKELWAAYNAAPDFSAKKEAFIRLEKFYRYYHLDSAQLICMQFKELAGQTQPDYVPFVDLRIAATYTRQLEFEKAGNIILPILEKAEKDGIDSLKASALLCLAVLNVAQKQYPLSIQRAREAARLHEQLHNWRDLCSDNSIIANAFSRLEQSQDSCLYFNVRALEIAEAYHLEDTKGTLLNNLGVFYHRNGDMPKAIEYYKKAAENYKNQNERFGLCFSLLNIGHAYRKLKQYNDALPWYDDAMPVCESCGNVEGIASIHMGKAEIYETLGDYKAALAAQKELNETEKKLNEETYNRNTQTLEAKYGTEKKERELGEQREKNYRQMVALYSLAAALIAFLGFAYLFYNRFRLRKKAELAAAVIREQKLGLNAVIEAQEAERKRIARELHDGIAQELVALKLGFDVLGRRVGKIAPDESPRIAELSEQLNASCTEVRSISHLMSPPTLEQKGLAPSLELLLQQTLQHTGMEARFEARDIPAELDEKVKVGLYRITQELLNNVIKHAHAAKVAIELFQKEKSLVLKVEDDGVGYNFEEARFKGSMGLLNILSRAGALGGEFQSEKRTPNGTIALVTVPVQ